MGQPEPCRSFLFYTDIWQDLNPNAYSKEAKKPVGLAASKLEDQLAEERLEAIKMLQELLCKHFGTTKDGWKAVFDEKGAFKIERPKFIAGCKKLAKKSGLEEYPTDPYHVFKLLHVEHPHELPGFL